MTILVSFGILALIGVAAYLVQIAAVRSTLSRGRSAGPHPRTFDVVRPFFFPISVIKPLKGLDDNLFDNLASFCVQDYPRYELIFSLQDANDPAYKVLQKVQEKYPGTDISIVVERCAVGLNPKVNNMIRAYERAKYEHVLISDSNVMVRPEYLRETAAPLADPGVGLVSNVVRGVRAGSLGAVLENLHLNTFIASSVCFLDRFLRMPCVIGKSMLFRRADLEAVGGLHAVRNHLAEDYLIGRMISETGKRVVLSGHVIDNVNERWDISRFLNRHTRWGKLRWRIGGLRYLSELLGNPVFLALQPLIWAGVSGEAMALFSLIAFVKGMGDYVLGRLLDSGQRVSAYLLAPLKDILIGYIWFVPVVNNTVAWRGNRYVIGKDSLLSPCAAAGGRRWPYRIAAAIRTRFA